MTRPQLNDLELSFILELLKLEEARMKQQAQYFSQEALLSEREIDTLRHKLIYESPYHTYQPLKAERERLKELEQRCIPLTNKRTVILHGLIVRFEKMLAHKCGRIRGDTFFMRVYLKEICTENTLKLPAFT